MELEIAGEKPEDVLTEIGRLFVDEFGFASSVDITEQWLDHHLRDALGCTRLTGRGIK